MVEEGEGGSPDVVFASLADDGFGRPDLGVRDLEMSEDGRQVGWGREDSSCRTPGYAKRLVISHLRGR